MAYNLESALLRSIGDSMMPLIFLFLTSILNIFLDILFLWPLKMGVAGAALATVISQGICAALAFITIRRNHQVLRTRKEDASWDRGFVLSTFLSGFSMALMNAIYNIGSVILQSSINALGSVYISAQVGARRIAEAIYLPGSSIGLASATFAGQNYGAGKKSRIGQGVLYAMLLYFIWWLMCIIAVFRFAPSLVFLVTGSQNEQTIESAVAYLRINIPFVPPMGMFVILRNVFQAIKHLVTPIITSTIELMTKIAFALLLVPAYGYIAVCICEPTAWMLCFAYMMIALFLFRKDFRD